MEQSTVIVFDLDDTLYKEIDYVISAFHEIDRYIASTYKIENCFSIMYDAHMAGLNPFDALPPSISLQAFLDIYRYHNPNIKLDNETSALLQHLHKNGYTIAIITDGRSISQRNKINALGINHLIANDNIIISDEFGSSKIDARNFLYFNNKYPQATRFIYIGDNPKKDFIAPNSIPGWTTICLKDNGKNIHPQSTHTTEEHRPHHTITSIKLLLQLL